MLSSIEHKQLDESIQGVSGFSNVLSNVLGTMSTTMKALTTSATRTEDDIAEFRERFDKMRANFEKLSLEFKNSMIFGGGGGGSRVDDDATSLDFEENAPKVDIDAVINAKDESDEEDKTENEDADNDDEDEKEIYQEEVKENTIASTSTSTGSNNLLGKTFKGPGRLAKLIKSKTSPLVSVNKKKSRMEKGWTALTNNMSQLRDLSKHELSKGGHEISRKLRQGIFDAIEDMEGEKDVSKKIETLHTLCSVIASSVDTLTTQISMVNTTVQNQLQLFEKGLNETKKDVKDIMIDVKIIHETQQHHSDQFDLINMKLDYLIAGDLDHNDKEAMTEYLQTLGVENVEEEYLHHRKLHGIIGRTQQLEYHTEVEMPKTIEDFQESQEKKIKNNTAHIEMVTEQMMDLEANITGRINESKEEMMSLATKDSPVTKACKEVKEKWIHFHDDLTYALKHVIRILDDCKIFVEIDLNEEMTEIIDEIQNDPVKQVIPAEEDAVAPIDRIDLSDLADQYPHCKHLATLIEKFLSFREIIMHAMGFLEVKDDEDATLKTAEPELELLLEEAKKINEFDISLISDENDEDLEKLPKELKVFKSISSMQARDHTYQMQLYLFDACEISDKVLNLCVPQKALQRRVNELEKLKELNDFRDRVIADTTKLQGLVDTKVDMEQYTESMTKKASLADMTMLRDSLFSKMEGVAASSGKMAYAAAGGSGSVNDDEMKDLSERFLLLANQFDDIRSEQPHLIRREEVEEALSSLVGEVKVIKAKFVDRSLFDEQMKIKADQTELRALANALTHSVGELKNKTQELQLHQLEGMSQLNSVSGNDSGELMEESIGSMSMSSRIGGGIALQTTRCLVCDRLVDPLEEKSRPSTQPNKRRTARNKVRASSPQTQMDLSMGSVHSIDSVGSELTSKKKNKASHELYILKQSLDLPPITADTKSQVLSLSSVQSTTQRAERRLRTTGAAGMAGKKYRQNSR